MGENTGSTAVVKSRRGEGEIKVEVSRTMAGVGPYNYGQDKSPGASGVEDNVWWYAFNKWQRLFGWR